MTLPTVPFEAPDQSTITLPRRTSPYSLAWWTSQIISSIPSDAVGWLVAQGWQITDITYDQTMTPPTPYYTMARQSMQSWEILQTLLDEYQLAYNDAMEANQVRYNEVVTDWTEMIASSQTQFDAQVDYQNAHVTLFLANLDSYMSAVDELIEENQSQLVSDVANVTTAITELNEKLDDLETNVDEHTTTINALLTAQGTYLTTFLADFSAKLIELDTNYSAHLITILAELASSDTNYSAHRTTILAELTSSDTDLTTFIASQTDALSELETAYSLHAATVDGLLNTASSYLSTLSAEVATLLASLETDYTHVDAAVTALLSSGTSALSTYGTDYQTAVNLLTTDYTTIATELNTARTTSENVLTAHTTDFNTELSNLKPDYDSHSFSATGFLTDLGSTDLARINEHFAATLSTQLQQLTDQGLYNSIRAIDITARNARDKDEQIQLLNDRLNREKWENEHRLYDQQTSMQSRLLDGKTRIHGVEQDVRKDHVGQITNRFALQQSARDRTLTGIDHLHAVRQEIWRYQASQITGLYQLLQSVRDRTLSTKQAIYGLQDANSRLSIEVQSKLYEARHIIKRLTLEEAARLQQLKQAINQWQTSQHDTLLNQGQAINQWQTSQHDTLLNQVQAIEGQHLAGIDKQHAARQDISRVAMSERNTLLGQLQDAVKGILAGKERYSTLTMQTATTMAEHRHRAIVEKMNEYNAKLAGLQGKHEEDMKLMAYQLDERNKLLIGLYGFVKDREDVGPKFEALTQLCTSLGDAGGGWISP